MAALIRIVNAFYAALFLVAALMSLGFLLAARSPDAAWSAFGWAALAASLAILCLANMPPARGAKGLKLLVANLAASLLAAAGLLAGDTALQWIAVVAILPFAITVPALLAARARA
jgi:hypothetical protein